MKSFDSMPSHQQLTSSTPLKQDSTTPFEDTLPNRIVLLTGGTNGVGRECAKQMLALGVNVIITSSNEERAKQVAHCMECEDICEKEYGAQEDAMMKSLFEKLWPKISSPSSSSSTSSRFKKGKCIGMEMDLMDLEKVAQSCVKLCQEILPNHFGTDQLDGIVNNVGVVGSTGNEENAVLNPQGVSKTFSVCYLGHFLMNYLLRNRLRENGRIVVVSSNVVQLMISDRYTSLEQLDWMKMIYHEKTKGTIPPYAYNKLFCSMHCLNLHDKWIIAKECPHLQSVNYVHPGVMMTNLLERAKEEQKQSSPFLAYISYGIGKIIHAFSGIPISRGAFHELRLALDPSITCSGKFFFMQQEKDPKDDHILLTRKEEREKLWNFSMKIVGPFLERYSPLIEQ
nr:unnamed protein product [Naegleria fowleri]